MLRGHQWPWDRKVSEGDNLRQRIATLLDSHARRLRAADPATAQQWQSVRSRLAAGTEREAAPRQHARPRLLGAVLRPAMAYALAGAAIIAVLSILLVSRPSGDQRFATARGQQSSMVLPDSSEVKLNHTTEIIANRTAGGGRHLSLKGEAYFRVRRTGEPFIVSTDLGRVEVLGTEFDLLARENRLVLAVLTGKVRLTVRQGGKDSVVVLVAGQITTCPAGGFPTEPSVLPFAEYPGWVHGKLLLYRSTLREACDEISARFDLPLRIDGEELGGQARSLTRPTPESETITGLVDAASPQAAVAALSTLTGRSYRHENGGYTLY